ncbi:hypothetical protein UFOVP366_4 [uncultured Caudovirales phage]|uniref:Uncharacterized protein n=1 Tax=uncultured Caudovirales phage TaxID=2100421 RepID=A0A6J7WWN4_9CAUD|nr:hypothetical protein UFOVP366_4 [uncultured Caudovirales phage]
MNGKPQIWWAVYDTEADSDFYSFNTQAEAESEVQGWLLAGLVESLKDEDGKWCASWGRVYVCSADADTVPDDDADPNCEWSLWNYDWEEGAPKTNYRRFFASWGMSDWHEKNIVEKG